MFSLLVTLDSSLHSIMASITFNLCFLKTDRQINIVNVKGAKIKPMVIWEECFFRLSRYVLMLSGLMAMGVSVPALLTYITSSGTTWTIRLLVR